MFIHSFALGAGGIWRPLHGEFSITPAPLSDPIPDGPPVAFFTIDGDAAKTMFNGMIKPNIMKNACAGKGVVMKSVGDLICFKHGREYTCSFGVGLSDGKLQMGNTC
jgi:hypothetical protein